MPILMNGERIKIASPATPIIPKVDMAADIIARSLKGDSIISAGRPVTSIKRKAVAPLKVLKPAVIERKIPKRK